MKKALIVLCLTGFAPLAAMAQGSGGASPGGTDGCGLGWQVTDKKTWVGTTTRGTTNLFVPPTFGMTSGTIGCDQHPVAMKDMDAATFVATNLEPLSIEMAQGQGEYLTAFAQTMGCSDVSAFGRMTQNHYSEIMGTQSSGVEVFKRVKSRVQTDATLASSCGII